MIYKDIIKVLKKDSLLIDEICNNELYNYNKIETDSRKIRVGDVFVCISGFASDGHNFAETAKQNGATLIICERALELEVNQIVVNQSRKAAALLAKLFFNDPCKKISLIGVTGTNGKTTIVNILAALFSASGFKCGIIGTLGYKIGNKHFTTNHTTPDIVELYSILAKMAKAECDYIFMEVSSHAIALDRIYGLTFTGALFTNLTQDHLDFHKTMEDYAKIKFQFLDNTLRQGGFCLVNTDDEYGQKFCNHKKKYPLIRGQLRTISFLRSNIVISDYRSDIKGSSFLLDKDRITTKLIGQYNIFNTAIAISAAIKLVPEKKTEFIINLINIQPTAGRLQSIPNKCGVGIFVDYAHSPDAMANVLSALMEVKKEKLICVFGAGGDRDKSKRPLMLDAALKYSDTTIITTDNPRFEAPEDIIRDISSSPQSNRFWIIKDRRAAIRAAIGMSRKGDVVLISGKGHENYQDINGKKIHFDDADEVNAALNITPPLLNELHSKLAMEIDPLQLEAIFKQKLERADAITSISTDSRSILPNSLFFALKGENFDGHSYVQTVLETTGCLAVVDQSYPKNHPNLIKVQDVLESYGDLAGSYKTIFPAKSIAITGSVGKTTTKEYLDQILISVGPTLKTFANENNQIGLPKTIFRLQPAHEYAIYELGSNHFGEIESLAKIAEPDIAVITSIGASHLEFFGDLQGVLKEKSSLLKYARKFQLFPDDIPELNQIDIYEFDYDHNFRTSKITTFGNSDEAYFQISDVEYNDERTIFKLNYSSYELPSAIPSNLRNAAIAISIARLLKIDEKLIKKAISKPLHIPMRMEIVTSKQLILFIDCYNANPDSMKASIEFWSSYKPDLPHVAILGDMLELGALTEKFHKEICDLVMNKPKCIFISVGTLATIYKANSHFTKVDEIPDDILEQIPPDAVVLLKASHGIHLEKLLKRL